MEGLWNSSLILVNGDSIEFQNMGETGSANMVFPQPNPSLGGLEPISITFNGDNLEKSDVVRITLPESLQYFDQSVTDALKCLNTPTVEPATVTYVIEPTELVHPIPIVVPDSAPVIAEKTKRKARKQNLKSGDGKKTTPPCKFRIVEKQKPLSCPESEVAAPVQTTEPTSTQEKPAANPLSANEVVLISTRKKEIQQITPIQLKEIATVLGKTTNGDTAPTSESNAKVICRVMYPEDFAVPVPQAQAPPPKKVDKETKKRGRPRSVAIPEDASTPKPEPEPMRARSGRLVRPPKHIVEDFKKIPLTPHDDSSVFEDFPTKKPTEEPSVDLMSGLEFVPRKRDLIYKCSVCSKKYATWVKLSQHMKKFPSHVTDVYLNLLATKTRTSTSATKQLQCRCRCKSLENCRRRVPLKQVLKHTSQTDVLKQTQKIWTSSLTPWEFILTRIVNEHQGQGRVEALIQELSDLLEAVKSVSLDIFKGDETCDVVDVQNESVCQLLGVTQGKYRARNDAVPVPEHFRSVVSPLSPRDKSDSDLKDISENSLFNEILGDKTGMEAVDEIVSERLKTLTSSDGLLTPTDDLMANLLTVESESLTDSMMFPPAADLLKTFENFTEIQPTAPPQLDFTALSNEFSPVR